MPASINDPKHVIALAMIGLSLMTWYCFINKYKYQVQITPISMPLVDVQSKNSSIAILSLNQILILDVK